MISAVNMVGHATQNGVRFAGMGVAHRGKTTGSRNRLMETALATKDATHFLWIDDDHVFKPNILCNLLSRKVGMICSLMFQKIPPHYPTIYQVSKESEHLYHCFVKWPRAVFRIDGCGFGCVLMTREVAEQVKPPYFEEQTGQYGQDLHFCYKLRKLGIPIYCDGTQSILHAGYEVPMYGEEDFMKYQAGELDKVRKHNEEAGIVEHGAQPVEINNVLV